MNKKIINNNRTTDFHTNLYFYMIIFFEFWYECIKISNLYIYNLYAMHYWVDIQWRIKCSKWITELVIATRQNFRIINSNYILSIVLDNWYLSFGYFSVIFSIPKWDLVLMTRYNINQVCGLEQWTTTWCHLLFWYQLWYAIYLIFLSDILILLIIWRQSFKSISNLNRALCK